MISFVFRWFWFNIVKFHDFWTSVFNFKRIILEALIIFFANYFFAGTRSETFISGVFHSSLRRIASVGPEYHQPVEIQPVQRPGPIIWYSTQLFIISSRNLTDQKLFFRNKI